MSTAPTPAPAYSANAADSLGELFARVEAEPGAFFVDIQRAGTAGRFGSIACRVEAAEQFDPLALAAQLPPGEYLALLKRRGRMRAEYSGRFSIDAPAGATPAEPTPPSAARRVEGTGPDAPFGVRDFVAMMQAQQAQQMDLMRTMLAARPADAGSGKLTEAIIGIVPGVLTSLLTKAADGGSSASTIRDIVSGIKALREIAPDAPQADDAEPDPVWKEIGKALLPQLLPMIQQQFAAAPMLPPPPPTPAPLPERAPPRFYPTPPPPPPLPPMPEFFNVSPRANAGDDAPGAGGIPPPPAPGLDGTEHAPAPAPADAPAGPDLEALRPLLTRACRAIERAEPEQREAVAQSYAVVVADAIDDAAGDEGAAAEYATPEAVAALAALFSLPAATLEVIAAELRAIYTTDEGETDEAPAEAAQS